MKLPGAAVRSGGIRPRRGALCGWTSAGGGARGWGGQSVCGHAHPLRRCGGV